MKNAFEVPNSPNVRLDKMCITKFAGSGNTENVVNGTGGSTATGVKRVLSYSNGDGVQPFDEDFELPDRESYPE